MTEAMTKRVYIAGPMTGIEHHNTPAFDNAAARWRERGWGVVNPADSTREIWYKTYGEDFDALGAVPDTANAGGAMYNEFLKRDISDITTCNAIALLPGWEKSQGVAKELAVAKALGLDIYDAVTYEKIDTDRTNPKDAVGSFKLPLGLFPVAAIAEGSLAMLIGSSKYGTANFRASPVRASVYIDAALRHVYAFQQGELDDPDGGTHLGNALACVAILIDARAAKTLIDDRPIQGGYAELLDALTPRVGEIRKRFASRQPFHFTRNNQ